MQQVFIDKLTVSPEEALDTLEPVYRALRAAAAQANDLHSYLTAELALASLQSCRWALLQPQCYVGSPFYLKAEPQDSAEVLFKARCDYVYNAPQG